MLASALPIAARVRKAVVGDSPRGLCAEATEALVAALRDAGIDARHGFGHFRFADGGPDDLDNWCEHHFAVVDGHAIDVTADQFDGNGVAFPRVMVGPIHPPESREIGHHWSGPGPAYVGPEDGATPRVPKRLKFARPLVALVLHPDPALRKDVTWRVGDDKGLAPGDLLELACAEDGKTFALAECVSADERTFGTLRPEDRRGHEPFASHAEMLATYSGYYRRGVGDDDPVKVVRFCLLALPPDRDDQDDRPPTQGDPR